MTDRELERRANRRLAVLRHVVALPADAVVAAGRRHLRGGGVVSRIPDQEPGRGRRQGTVGDGHRCRDSSSLLWPGACDE